MAKELFKYATDEQIQEMKEWYSQENEGFIAHDWNHILNVVQQAQEICLAIGHPYTHVIEYGCMFHDMGVIHGREHHHKIGAEMAYEKALEWGLSNPEEVMMCVEHHRASSLKDETIKEFLSKPKNKYLLIVND